MISKNLHSPGAIRKTVFTVLAVTTFASSSISQTSVAVAPNKMNVLYIGVDNPVTVAASEGSDDKVNVSISGCEGKITKTAAGQYNVLVSNVTDDCSINVYVGEKLVGSSKFRVRNLPRPFATVGGHSSGSTLSTDDLKMQAGLGVYIKDSPFEVRYEVNSFSIKLLDDKKKIITVDCKGAYFSPLAKQYIAEYLKPGDILQVEKIYVKDQAGKEMKLPALVYNIK